MQVLRALVSVALFSLCTALYVFPAAQNSGPVYNEAEAKLIASFEDGAAVWEGGTPESIHATNGVKSLRIEKTGAKLSAKQDWTGYDLFLADIYTDSADPLQIYMEVSDEESAGYWTRVNIYTLIMPGKSTLVIPVKHLYVGEKSRPGRMLKLDRIKLFSFSQIDDTSTAPYYIDNLRLVKDTSADGINFDGLKAFSFGTPTAPVMDGYTRVTKTDIYSNEKGYGFENAKILRDFNFLQPEPLYQTCICIEEGSFKIDLPNGKYRVFMNLDNPSGYWGEYQVYSERSVTLQGRKYTETITPEEFKKKYYRFWNIEDSPTEDTFDKYQLAYYKEKEFQVEVTDGRLNIEFSGKGFANSLSALVIYPEKDTEKGKAFLDFTKNKRKFYFDNYFKRVLHKPTGTATVYTDEEKDKGYSVFGRDFMKDIYYNDMPEAGEKITAFHVSAFAGEYAPLTFAVHALKNLGKVAVTISELAGKPGVIPSSSIEINYVSNRVTRSNMEGTAYSINPRLLMPFNSFNVESGLTRWFWLTVKTPKDAAPGMYSGSIRVTAENGKETVLPLNFTVNKGVLDAADVPVGPFYFGMDVPLKDPEWKKMLDVKSIKKMKEYGMTTFSSGAFIKYDGFKDGKSVLDFSNIDETMEAARKEGFSMPVVLYGGGIRGFNPYFIDTKAMEAAGFKDYSEFIKAVYTPVQKHAEENNWLPVYFCLGDEPVGKDIDRSAENAAAYNKAFPKGPPYFTVFSSFTGNDTTNTHYKLGKEFSCPSFNLHDESSIELIKAAGKDWAFYNSGSRWTYGIYLFKAAKEFDVKYRVSWHWNNCAGDPYYALDCREDDYAWANSSPDGLLILAVTLEREIRTGIDDYRRLLTLSRLVKEKAGTPSAEAGKIFLEQTMSSFKLGQSRGKQVYSLEKWQEFRNATDKLINDLR